MLFRSWYNLEVSGPRKVHAKDSGDTATEANFYFFVIRQKTLWNSGQHGASIGEKRPLEPPGTARTPTATKLFGEQCENSVQLLITISLLSTSKNIISDGSLSLDV